MSKILIILFLITVTLNSDSDRITTINRCKHLYLYYNIDLNIKSRKGWLRVCHNNKFKYYCNKYPPNLDLLNMCECIQNVKLLDIKHRSIGESEKLDEK